MMMMLLFLLHKLGKSLSKEAKGRTEVTEARKEREYTQHTSVRELPKVIAANCCRRWVVAVCV
jgi:hypothetical protein